MTSLQRITPAREHTLQTADDRGVYNDGKRHPFILIIKKICLKYIKKSFFWRLFYIAEYQLSAEFFGIYFSQPFYCMLDKNYYLYSQQLFLRLYCFYNKLCLMFKLLYSWFLFSIYAMSTINNPRDTFKTQSLSSGDYVYYLWLFIYSQVWNTYLQLHVFCLNSFLYYLFEMIYGKFTFSICRPLSNVTFAYAINTMNFSIL